ncbi:MAG: group II intron maturase-specific domain-containing protein [Prochloraceae cyanobacterium]|nr:group II intron maturase-specific domain-containing protein [Prochloraceae cyanobacterium]
MEDYEQEKAGFDFLGFTIRQFKVGKHHSGKNTNKNLLGFKTIIQPSKVKILAHYQKLKDSLNKMKAVEQTAVIKHLNPIIRGWCNYQSPWHSSTAYSKVKNLLWNRLWRWAKRRHPNKSRKWIAKRYFLLDSEGWRFGTRREGKNPLRLLKHSDFPASGEFIKVEGNRSPFDGDENYWSKRMGERYSTLDPQKARLLKRQKGECAYCGLSFKPDDVVEKHHLESKSSGGRNTDNNLVLLHLHCHDQAEAQLCRSGDVVTEKLKRNAKISSSKQEQSKRSGNKKKSGRSQAKAAIQSRTKERSEVKVSRSVLKPSQGGDLLA